MGANGIQYRWVASAHLDRWVREWTGWLTPRFRCCSERYYDDIYEYRHVVLPVDIAKRVPKGRLMSEVSDFLPHACCFCAHLGLTVPGNGVGAERVASHWGAAVSRLGESLCLP